MKKFRDPVTTINVTYLYAALNIHSMNTRLVVSEFFFNNEINKITIKTFAFFPTNMCYHTQTILIKNNDEHFDDGRGIVS